MFVRTAHVVRLLLVATTAYALQRSHVIMQSGVSASKGFVRSLFSPLSHLSRSIQNLFAYKTRNDAELKEGIAGFYDKSSAIWLDVWGEHMHHGYYPSASYKDHNAAQIDMIDRSLDFAFAHDTTFKPRTMVDVGCGVGGSSRHIARKLNVTGEGLSLSPYQIKRAQRFTQEQNLSHALRYAVNDAMNMPFKDESFDLTWSMESGEHTPDKKRFMQELVRVTAPGGRIIVVTWCHRELKADEKSLQPKELRLLDKINDAYFLPAWVPGSLYVKLARELGLEDIKYDDWSEFIAPFWPAVFKSALKPLNFVRSQTFLLFLIAICTVYSMFLQYSSMLARFGCFALV